MKKYPYQLRAGDKIDGQTVEAFRDSRIRNSRTGDFDIAIEFKESDALLVVPRSQVLEVG